MPVSMIVVTAAIAIGSLWLFRNAMVNGMVVREDIIRTKRAARKKAAEQSAD